MKVSVAWEGRKQSLVSNGREVTVKLNFTPARRSGGVPPTVWIAWHSIVVK